MKFKRKETTKIKHKESNKSINQVNENELKKGVNINHTYFEHLIIN